jgi:hypothetical protein
MSEKLDRAIDDAVRQMLDVEPPMDLRRRVMARIETDPPVTFVSIFRRHLLWIPAAAAAAVILAVVWSQPRPAPRPLPSIARAADQNLPAPDVGTMDQPAPIIASRTASPPRPLSHVNSRRATAAAADEDTNFSAIPALASPASLSVKTLEAPSTVPMPSIAPIPMRISALEIAALSETPHERRKE